MAKLNWQIVDRYFAGEATAAERALVEEWLAESPAFRMLVEELYRDALDDDATRQASAEVRAKLAHDTAIVPASSRRHRLPRRIADTIGVRGIGMLKAAAIIAALLGGALLVRQTVWMGEISRPSVELRTVSASSGQRLPLSLPDGSQVMLGPGSTLRYAAAFDGKSRREVHLEGEAYFDVRHDAQRPFVVRAGDLIAEDLGTQFVVRAYPEDAYGRVVVREGLVGVAGAVVAPGELGRLSKDGKPIVEPADTASWFAWTRGRLIFNGMPLRDALPKLSRWYDLEFRLADRALGDRIVVANPPESSDDAITVMALALNLRAVRTGRVVTFSAR